ncbi:MAG: hypothetical protein OH319_00840 [Candidatus Parvarchaeota archaeon]|nr:hypothetical protein [Candidatus Jingweiarchaeum tengchongense]MCW1297876.1 hypothetical protein [Candidatus Jingweiarchaeum tengchongense]MCW1299887.1 hypothetical protein [Candidatus Jingweiarchaeum tengchongense]MCW1305109.1 hypothetical protein [Candidatus Jingweiarchaeum tengchongense]MCW1305171.1 hypothetical protein [Candidatus Jingweiarchaeum tengchongense]
MARTFLDAVGIFQEIGLQYFLVPLTIGVIVFAILEKTKLFSDKTEVNLFIGILIFFFTAMFPPVTDFLYNLLPFFAVLLIILFFMLLFFLFMGAKTEDVANAMKNPAVYMLLIVISIIFVMYVAGNVFYTQLNPPTNYTENVSYTNITTEGGGILVLKNPKVFGMVVFLLLLAVAAFAIVYKPK